MTWYAGAMSMAEREEAIALALEEAESLAAAREHLAHGQTAEASEAVERAFLLAFKRVPAVPVSLAARLLQVSEATVRKWISLGVLDAVRSKPVAIDPGSLFGVLGMVRKLREQGADPTVRELLLARIDDDLFLQEPALQQSLREMREGKIHWIYR